MSGSKPANVRCAIGGSYPQNAVTSPSSRPTFPVHEPDGPQARLFYGWVIAFSSAIGIGLGVSVYLPSTIGLLIGPLHRDLGWTASQILLALTFATVSTLIAAPLVGILVDRFGARKIIALSFVCQGLLIASCRYLNGDIGWLYARYAAFALLCTGTTAIGFSALIAKWFRRRRGLALGIALGGLGAGGVFWSLLTQWLLDHLGWRQAFPWLGGIVIAAAPVLALILRDDPAAMGLAVDGEIGTHDRPIPAAQLGQTLRSAAASGQYWLMMLTFFIIACATYGVTLNLVPLLVSRGDSATEAAHVQASLWSILVFGRISTGWLMDRYFAPRVALAFLIPALAGTAMLADGTSGTPAFVAAMLLGLASGSEVDVMAYLVSRYFGLKHFGAIYATYFSVYAVGTSTGPFLAATFAAATGSYRAPLWCLFGALCISAVLLSRFRRFSEPL